MGSARYSREGPGTVDADAFGVGAEMTPARQAIAAAAADHVAFAADDLAREEVLHVGSDLRRSRPQTHARPPSARGWFFGPRRPICRCARRCRRCRCGQCGSARRSTRFPARGHLRATSPVRTFASLMLSYIGLLSIGSFRFNSFFRCRLARFGIARAPLPV